MPLQNNELLFSIKELSFSYNRYEVLKEVSLKVHKGEFIAVIGPNGGGKTTLLKLISGFLQPNKGYIHFTHPFPNISYVPQSTNFDRQFPISVMEVVLSGLLFRLPWWGVYHHKEKIKAEACLERVGLQKFASISFGELSGGQAQRVLIARALVSEPELLLLDEPTASVDSKARDDILTLLDQLKGSMTIMMVTHDLEISVKQADRLLCVQNEIACLKPAEVCEHFAMGLYHQPLVKRNCHFDIFMKKSP